MANSELQQKAQRKPRGNKKEKKEIAADPGGQNSNVVTVAIKRNGDMLRLHDEVTVINYHEKCDGHTFIIFEMNHFSCESGVMCKVHLKGNEEAVLKTKNELGLDANWFEKVLP